MSKKKTNNGFIRELELKDSSVRLVYNIFLITGIVIAVVSVAPLFWVILSGFKEVREFARETSIFPKRIDFAGYIKTWKDLRIGLYFRNSLISVVGSVICAVFFNGLLGYALSKIKPVGSKLVFGLVLWSMLIPATVSVVPLFMNISRLRLTGTFIPLWLSIGANAFFVILFKEFFDDLPQSFVEAARIDGAADFTIFMRIAVPLSKAIIMVIVIYAINAAWSDFLLPYLVLKNSNFETVMVRLFEFRAGRISDVDVLRAIVFIMLPPVILYFIFQKQITQISLRSGIRD
ncbi:MAG TPA: carbohydrate ABC transporter permease [Treponema sp.]|nr:carbohydrate ABC transporter permease [Treponema sp.]